MLSQILVPLDGSQFAERALLYAQTLARVLTLPVELLEVVDISTMSAHRLGDKARFLDRFIADAERAGRQYLEDIAHRLSGIAVDVSVRPGKPAAEILKAAGPGTLVAMASHGRSGVRRWLLGSVAEKVLRGGHSPLLLVRAGDDRQAAEPVLHSIIVPLDGSSVAEAVLPLVAEVAGALKAAVLLFRVFELPASAYYGRENYLPNYEDMKKRIHADAQRYLDAQTAVLKNRGLTEVSSLLCEGVEAGEIIRCARERPQSLIAMCTHGRSGVRRWVLGSVTEKVVRHTANPVLVIAAG